MKYDTYLISDLIDEISMGPFGSNIKVECFVDNGVPVLNGSNLDGFELSENAFRYVTEEKADSLKKANAHKGDIVITHRGTLGQIVYIPQTAKYDRYVISQSQFRIRCNEKVLPEYLVYYFHTPIGQHKLLSNASQVGVPALARPSSTFQQIEVELPDIDTQKRVVRLINSFQQLIKLNKKINANLEEQAQALFKHWFVDFEFPNEEGKPYRSSGGKMVESEMGLIPEGWQVRKLGEIINLPYGKPLKAENRIHGPYPVYGSNGIIGWHNKWMIKGPGIIIGRKGTPGVVTWSHQDFFPIDTTFYVESKLSCISVHFLYFLLKHLNLPNLSADSAVPGLNRVAALSQNFVFPHESKILDFEQITLHNFAKMQNLYLQNIVHDELLETLLSHLLHEENDII